MLNEIQSERLKREFIRLTQIDSLTFQEREMADYIKERMEKLHIHPYEDQAGRCYSGNAGNVYGYFKDSDEDAEKKTILFSAHLDTVAPGIGKKAIVHEDGTITSDGTTVLGADDLAGIAVILEAITEIQEEGLRHHEIELLFTIAEEAYTLGAAAFDYTKLKAEEAYVLDVSGPVGTISMQEPTLISWEVTVRGKAAHAGFEASKGINAIAIAAEAITKIPQGQLDEHTTFNIGTIQGGEATNIISDCVVVKGETRCTNHQRAVTLVENAIQTFEEAANAHGGTVDSKYDIHLTAYDMEIDEPVVVNYKKVCEDLGIPVNPVRTFGGSDNNVFKRHGIHGAVIGNGMQKIHTRQESISLEDLKRAVQIVKALMVRE